MASPTIDLTPSIPSSPDSLAPSNATQPEQNWRVVLQVIGQIAIRLLVCLSSAYLLFLVLPASISVIALPVAVFSISFAVAFLFTGQEESTVVRQAGAPQEISPLLPPIGVEETLLPAATPLSLETPPGLKNASMNCWLNALLQTVRCDERMQKWFLEIPQEWLPDPALLLGPTLPLPSAIAAIPFLAPPILSLISPTDLAIPPALGVFSQSAARTKLQQYFTQLESCPHAASYFHFFAATPPAERQSRWNGLVAFNRFLHAYAEAEEEGSPLVAFDSQILRSALWHLNQSIPTSNSSISSSAGIQQDPAAEGLSLMLYLMPEIQNSIEVRTIVDRGELPAIEEGEVSLRKKSDQIGYMVFNMMEDHPDVQAMVDHFSSAENLDQKMRVERKGVDRIVYKYPVSRKEQQFYTAPPSLWLHLLRMSAVPSTESSGFLGVIPNLFSKKKPQYVEAKVRTPVTAQSVIHVEQVDGTKVDYELDSFIVHIGNTLRSGHYVAYKLVRLAPGNEAWFKMNDRSVSRVTLEEKEAAAANAYIYHYSKLSTSALSLS